MTLAVEITIPIEEYERLLRNQLKFVYATSEQMNEIEKEFPAMSGENHEYGIVINLEDHPGSDDDGENDAGAAALSKILDQDQIDHIGTSQWINLYT